VFDGCLLLLCCYCNRLSHITKLLLSRTVLKISLKLNVALILWLFCVDLEKGLRFCCGIWRSRYLEVEKHRVEDLTVQLTALLQLLMWATPVRFHHCCMNDMCDLLSFTCHNYCINVLYNSI